MRHVEGDPDEPLVMNRLYNAVTPPPYALPGGKALGLDADRDHAGRWELQRVSDG